MGAAGEEFSRRERLCRRRRNEAGCRQSRARVDEGASAEEHRRPGPADRLVRAAGAPVFCASGFDGESTVRPRQIDESATGGWGW